MLTLKQLRAFVSASRSLSFTRTAQQLHLTQSAVSLLIRDLERELDLPLFERGRRLALTELGAQFARSAQSVLGNLDLAVANLREARDARRGVLRVGVGHLLASTLFPAAIVEFKRAFPTVDVGIVDCQVGQLAAKVLAGEVDVAIGSIDYESRYPDLDLAPLFRDSVHLASAPSLAPLGARRGRLTWRRLQGEPLIVVNAGNRVWSDLSAVIERQNLRLQVAYEVALFSTGIALARRGLGRLLLPGFCARAPDLHDLAIEPLTQPVIRWDVSVLQRHGSPTGPAVRALTELLRGSDATTSAAR